MRSTFPTMHCVDSAQISLPMCLTNHVRFVYILILLKRSVVWKGRINGRPLKRSLVLKELICTQKDVIHDLICYYFFNRALMFLSTNFDGVVQEMNLNDDDKELLALINRELQTYIENMEQAM